jgi:hypothetical protein
LGRRIGGSCCDRHRDCPTLNDGVSDLGQHPSATPLAIIGVSYRLPPSLNRISCKGSSYENASMKSSFGRLKTDLPPPTRIPCPIVMPHSATCALISNVIIIVSRSRSLAEDDIRGTRCPLFRGGTFVRAAAQRRLVEGHSVGFALVVLAPEPIRSQSDLKKRRTHPFVDYICFLLVLAKRSRSIVSCPIFAWSSSSSSV